MKKLFSAFVVVAMIASTMFTSVYAANNQFVVNAPSGELEIGNEVTVTVDLNMVQGIAGFNTDMTFDTTVFEAVSAAATRRTDWMGAITGGLPEVANQTGKFTAQYVSAENDEVFDDAFYQLTYKFKVKENAPSGTYTFGYIVNEAVNQDKQAVVFDESDLTNATVTVKGIAVEEKTHAVVKDDYVGTNPAVNNKYSKGFKVEVTPNDDKLNSVSYALKCAGKESLEGASGSWDNLALSGAVTYSFAINVINIPSDVNEADITNTWTVDITAAE